MQKTSTSKQMVHCDLSSNTFYYSYSSSCLSLLKQRDLQLCYLCSPCTTVINPVPSRIKHTLWHPLVCSPPPCHPLPGHCKKHLMRLQGFGRSMHHRIHCCSRLYGSLGTMRKARTCKRSAYKSKHGTHMNNSTAYCQQLVTK